MIVIVVGGDADDGPPAHGTDLDLEEPPAETGFVKDVLTVRDLHQGVLPSLVIGCLVKGFQADTAV